MPPLITFDADLPLETMNDLVGAAGREGYTDVVRLLRARKERERAKALTTELFFLAWDRGALTGVAALERDGRPEKKGVLRATILYVMPPQRRRSLGRMLVERAIAHVGRTFSSIEVTTRAPLAPPFLSALGFARVPGLAEPTFRRALAR